MSELASYIIAILTGGTFTGALTAIYFRRENKQLKKAEVQTVEVGVEESKADALSKYGTAMQTLISNIDDQQKIFKKHIEEKDLIIEQQKILIERYIETLKEAEKKIKELEYKISDYDRKITGMQRAIDNEFKERRTAENNICFVKDCKIREPKIGTYKKEIETITQ